MHISNAKVVEIHGNCEPDEEVSFDIESPAITPFLYDDGS
jgi:hypothetical protein